MAGAKKAYAKPSLKKGPRLSEVTAGPSSSDVPCWVARAAFGEFDFRWMIFRAWLLENAPQWFRAVYVRHGQRFAELLSERDHLRAATRFAMSIAIRKKLR